MRAIPKEDRIPRDSNDYKKEIVDERRKWLEQRTATSLKQVELIGTDTEQLKGNIENLFGICQIPLGVAGPLLIKGEHAQGVFYIPMATTEGALVLDYHLGALACSEAGGISVKILRDEVHISPLFYVKDVIEAQEFIRWINLSFQELKQIAESTTSHGILLRIEPVVIARRVILRVIFDSKDAHGLNMINKATEQICEHISSTTGKAYCLRSHYSSIKGVSTANYHQGQAKWVFADVIIPKKIITRFLHTTPMELQSYHASSLYAALQSNRLGHNGHFANGIAAMFIACGQDVADVAVSHIGTSSAEVTEDGDLYISASIPNLFVGTVGGGTGLGTQRECLEMLGCYGTGKVKKFAEIVAAVALAGELAVLGALVNGNYVKAHEIHGRNRPS